MPVIENNQPVINQVVLKIASRCNINCTYCYMYNKGDNSYKIQPKTMSVVVQNELFHKIREHCLAHGVDKFTFYLHGGEPLLAGKTFLRKFIGLAKSILNPEVDCRFVMQTNGMLIDDEWCLLFKELNIMIGLSLDLTPESHDLYRIDHKGKGSYDRVINGFNYLNKHGFGNSIGVLGVVDIKTEPKDVYEHYTGLGLKAFELLLPDHTRDDPPPGLELPASDRDETPYGDWLIQLFKIWYHDPERPMIRFFQSIVKLVLGQKARAEYFGAEKTQILVIETNGGAEPVDALKICGESFTKTQKNIVTHSVDDILDSELIKIYYNNKTTLCTQCANCPVSHICAAGYLPHRYSRENGFNNPSVYCLDLLKIITHIQNTVLAEFTDQQLEDYNLAALSYEEAKLMISPVADVY